jgi:hypothetical protein
MTNAVMASAPGVWGPGVRRATDAVDAAGPLMDAARHGARGMLDLAAASPALVIALAVGLALWLVGDRLFRPAASLVGAVLGALLGLAVSSSWQDQVVAGVPAPYAAIGLGSLLGLAIGAAMYRLAVGGAAALTLAGVAGALAAAISLHDLSNAPGERPETIAEVRAAGEPAVRVEHVSTARETSLENLQTAAASLGSTLREEWIALPEHVRSVVLAASILGCVVGFAAGVIRPRTAGPAVAALAGSALWIGATTALLIQSGRHAPPLPTDRPGSWLVAWLLVALIGFAVQRRMIQPAAKATQEA